MPSQEPSPPAVPYSVPWTRSPLVFWAILVITWIGCAAFLGVHCFLEHERLAVVSDCWLPDDNVAGYCWGKASGHNPQTPGQILPGNFVDGFHWTRNAQYMYEHGIWRLRWVPFDNAPFGRQVHWHSGLAWMLIAQGQLYHWLYDAPVTVGIERAAPGVNILPLFACLIFLSWATARRLGPWAGALLAVSMLSASVFFENFMFGNPDHHGLFDLGALGSMLLLLTAGMGWLRDPESALQPDLALKLYEHSYQARRWFILSAVFGAYGLWVSATFQAMVLILIGMAALAANAFFMFGSRGKGEGLRFDPTLWRVWGIAGAIGSIFFYMIEYFPSHLSMRLESNHPLYAISWLGGGEMLCWLTRWQVQRLLPRKPVDLVLAILSVPATSALPLGVFVGGSAWYTPSDAFMWRLHRYIEEFAPLWWRTEFFQPVTALQVFGVFPLLLLLAIGLCCWRGVHKLERASLVFALIPALLCMVSAIYQGRWYQVGQVGLLLLVVLCGAIGLALIRRQERFSLMPFLTAVTAPLVIATLATIGLTIYAAWNAFSQPPTDPNVGSSWGVWGGRSLGATLVLVVELAAAAGLWHLRRMTLPRVAPLVLAIATIFFVPAIGSLLVAIFQGNGTQLLWTLLAINGIALAVAVAWFVLVSERRILSVILVAGQGFLIGFIALLLILSLALGTLSQAGAVAIVLLIELSALGIWAWLLKTRAIPVQPILVFLLGVVVLTLAGIGMAIGNQDWPWFVVMLILLAAERTLFVLLALAVRATVPQIAAVFLALLMLAQSPFPFLLMSREWTAYTRRELQVDFLEYVVMRDIASRLRDRYGAEKLVILSSPSDSLPLSYFSGGRAIGTLYWENLDGLRAAAAMYASHNDEEVRKMMRERGVTHFVTVSRRDFVGGYYELDKGQFDEEGLKKCFAYRLFVDRKIPNWLRPMPLPYLMDPQLGRHVNAVFVFEVALDQSEADCHFHLGNFYADMKRPDEAIGEWARALQIDPDRLDVLPRLIRNILKRGETQKASKVFAALTEKASPEKLAPIRVEVAECFASVGALPQAILHYRVALETDPKNLSALNNLAWLLSTCAYRELRNGPQAVELAERAVQIGGKQNRDLLNTLAAAYAEVGRFADAVATTKQALTTAEEAQDKGAIKKLRDRLDLYQRGRPYRD